MIASFSQLQEVTSALTAAQVGSGLLPVYATPSVVALMENTACALLNNLNGKRAISEAETTVGVRMNIAHVKATPVGETVTCTATLTAQRRRRYYFSIVVTNAKGETLATATHQRVRVDKERFMAKL